VALQQSVDETMHVESIHQPIVTLGVNQDSWFQTRSQSRVVSDSGSHVRSSAAILSYLALSSPARRLL
jgi:hypothetical protein